MVTTIDCSSRKRQGFTLIELLVVMGIISLLMSCLLPAVNRARRSARVVECASNMHQLCQGMFGYVAEHRNRFPPNVYGPSPGQYWYEEDRVGGYVVTTGARRGGVLSCPEDPDGLRSYAMNAWMSSLVDAWVLKQTPVAGSLWGSAPRLSSNVILFIESWSGVRSTDEGWCASAIVGYTGSAPGPRFGAAGGLPPVNAGRWGLANSEVDFRRHRNSGSTARLNEPIGAVNIAYADGHVDFKSSAALTDSDGRSTLDSLWSPMDQDQNR
jgi:prepilin-type N-terminal cleavage/methylation domain-containing protein/prepilin-type processing-associated H-X9-DG protein